MRTDADYLNAADAIPLIFLIGILTMSMFFFTGLHNIDNAWNMRYYEYEHGIENLVDSTITGEECDATELYGLGMATIGEMFFFDAILMFLFGFYISRRVK